MGVRTWRQLLFAAVACGALISPAVVDAQGRGGGAARPGWNTPPQPSLQRPRPQRGVRENRGAGLRGPRLAADPYTTGYERGLEKGVEDGRDGGRYDPVRHRSYRDGDEGYTGDYGSRDAYRTNYRAGFRQGYEEGYRQGTRNRR